MTLFVLAYLAGVFTIVTPCIAPILPIVLSRASQPWRTGALPLLLGLAVAFAAAARPGPLARGRAVRADRHGPPGAPPVQAGFRPALLFANLAHRALAPGAGP